MTLVRRTVFISTEIPNYHSVIESILFAAGEPVLKEDLIKSIPITPLQLETVLRELDEEYKKGNRGIVLSSTQDSVQLVSKPENFEYVKNTLKLEQSTRLSRAGAEVLALVAYKAPITRVEIDMIRGVNSSGALQRLIDQGLVRECGKKDVPGKPYLYTTTDDFLRIVGITDLGELPSFESFNKT